MGIEVHTKESTQDVYVENPEWEKPREPTDSNYHYEEKRPRALYLRQAAVTTEYRSVSLFHSLYQYTTTLITHKVIALSHIYTYMTLGLFTNIASMGSP